MTDVVKKIFVGQNEYLVFWCEGCECLHSVWYETPNPLTNGRWKWNGDLVNPTVSPSILVRGTVPVTNEEITRILSGEEIKPKPTACHSFVRDGRIEFLSDCTHHLAGQVKQLLPVSDWDK